MVAVLFVCLGNICRSPAAEEILRQQGSHLPDLVVASCGIGNWHIGQMPNRRMQEAAKKRGYTLASRAQQFSPEHLDRYDYILAADHEVLKDIYLHAKETHHRAKVHLIMSFSESYDNPEVPDPYYGGEADFEIVLDMLEDACQGLLRHITNKPS